MFSEWCPSTAACHSDSQSLSPSVLRAVLTSSPSTPKSLLFLSTTLLCALFPTKLRRLSSNSAAKLHWSGRPNTKDQINLACLSLWWEVSMVGSQGEFWGLEVDVRLRQAPFELMRRSLVYLSRSQTFLIPWGSKCSSCILFAPLNEPSCNYVSRQVLVCSV